MRNNILTEKNGRGGFGLQIVHIMADGTTRDSIAGVVIQSDQFYQVLQGILEKQRKVTG